MRRIRKVSLMGNDDDASTWEPIDNWDTFTDPWIVFTDTSDGTHPTQAGQKKIAARILELLS